MNARVILLGLIFALVLSSFVFADYTLKDSYTSGTNTNSYGSSGYFFSSTSFTASSSYTAKKISIEIRDGGAITGAINASIYDASSGLPIYAGLIGFSNNSFADGDLPDGSFLYVNFTLGAGLQINASNQYAIALEYPSQGGNYIGINYGSTAGQTVGTTNPINWVANLANSQYNFMLWEESTPATDTTSLQLNISSSLPANGTAFSYNTISFNLTANSSINFNCSLNINNVANETKNYSAGTNVQVNFNKTITSYGQSIYNISCRNNYTSKNTTNNLFWVDIIAPNAVFGIPNRTAYYSGNISFTLNASDETELFSINVTIDSIPLYYNSSVNGSSYLVNIIYPSENLTTGIHTFYATIKDGGTDYKLKQEYSTKKGFFSDFITYEYAGGAYTMKLKDSAITDQWISEKKLDRFSQTIKPSKNKGNSITLLETSTSKMHIETGKIGSKHGNMWIVTEDGHWRDFKVKNEPASFVERINLIDDYTSEIVVSGISNMEEIVLESFGEINSITKTLSVYKGQAVMAYSSSATIELPQTQSLNVTVDWDYVNFISANYTYNGTLKTVSVSNGSSYLLYTTTFNSPNAGGIYPFVWGLNITQTNGTINNYITNASQDVHYAQLNISFYDEENFTAINSSFNIYLTLEQVITKDVNNGFISIGNLTLGEYFIQAENTEYPRRGIFYNVTNETHKINMFMLRDSTGNDDIDFYILNDANSWIEDTRMTFFRQYNNTQLVVAQIETDYAGQARVFLDQQYEYPITLERYPYTTKTISLMPLLTVYNIPLESARYNLYTNVFEGISYSKTPVERIINVSNLSTNFSLTIYDGSSSLEYFGVIVNDHSFACIPASCVVNVSGSPAGGKATVQLFGNDTGPFNAHYFFKRQGWDTQYINDFSGIFDKLMAISRNVKKVMNDVKSILSGSTAQVVVASLIQTVVAVIAPALGIVGLGVIILEVFAMAYLMATGFLPLMIGLIIIIWGILIYLFMSRIEE